MAYFPDNSRETASKHFAYEIQNFLKASQISPPTHQPHLFIVSYVKKLPIGSEAPVELWTFDSAAENK